MIKEDKLFRLAVQGCRWKSIEREKKILVL